MWRIVWRRLFKVAAAAVSAGLALSLLLLRGPVQLYYGPPQTRELAEYANAHQGRLPPLPNPLRATFLLFGPDGLSYFHETATLRDPSLSFWEPGRPSSTCVTR